MIYLQWLAIVLDPGNLPVDCKAAFQCAFPQPVADCNSLCARFQVEGRRERKALELQVCICHDGLCPVVDPETAGAKVSVAFDLILDQAYT